MYEGGGMFVFATLFHLDFLTNKILGFSKLSLILFCHIELYNYTCIEPIIKTDKL